MLCALIMIFCYVYQIWGHCGQYIYDKKGNNAIKRDSFYNTFTPFLSLNLAQLFYLRVTCV